MAIKQYEYFGNQNPVMNARNASARMRAQNTANIAADQKNWANDPWFTLGSTIGQAWADRYNERGVEKGRGEMQSALDNYLKQNGGTQQSSVPNVGVDQEALANNSAQINGGVLGDLAIQPMTPQDAYKEYKNQAWLSKYGDPNNPNPDSSAIQVKNDVQGMDKMGDGIDFGKINKEDARQAMREQLRQNGRTPYQIDQVMSQFDSMYDAKANKWHEARGTDYLQKGVAALNNGDFNGAYQNFAAAGEHGNKQAQAYMQRIGAMEQRKMQQDRFDWEKEKYAQQMAWEKEKFAQQQALKQALSANKQGAGNGGTVVGTVDGSPYTLDMYKADSDIVKNLDPENPIYRAASARILQLGFGIDFSKGKKTTEKPTTPNPKAHPNSLGFNTTNLDGDEDDEKNYHDYHDYGDLAQDIAHGVPRNLAMERARKRTGIGK